MTDSSATPPGIVSRADASGSAAGAPRTTRRPATLLWCFVGFAIFFIALFGKLLLPGAYMTSGDGILQAIPTFFGRTPLWEPDIMMGYPLFADPNQAFWYPVLRLVRVLPDGFNVYVALPYVIGSFGLYGFARRATGSTPAGIVAGTVFGLGGFMMSHQGHLNLIHPAAWSPYVLWAVEALRRRTRAAAVAGGALCFALSALSGSQQPLAYVSLVAIAYAVVMPALDGRRLAFLGAVALMFVFGVGLSAIATIPAYELASLSSRSSQTLGEFAAFSVTLGEFPSRVFFPYFLGASSSPAYPFSALNVAAATETTNYAGLLPLLLAAVAVVARAGERRAVWFWLGVLVWSAWMSVGDALHGAWLAYHLPIYGAFRIPGRHALEWTMAVAVLAAYGVRALETGTVRTREVAVAVAIVTVAFLGALISLAVSGDALRAELLATYAPGASGATVPVLPWQNPAIGIPCAVFVVALGVAFAWRRFGATRAMRVVGIVAVACDMLTFASQSYWRFATVAPNDVLPTPLALELRGDVERSGQRVLDTNGTRFLVAPGTRAFEGVPPNLSALWLVPSLGGYVSLEDRRFATLAGVDSMGELAPSEGDERVLDALATRFVVAPSVVDLPVPVAQALAGGDLDGFIGADALTPSKSLTYDFPSNTATSVVLVSALGRSAAIPNDAVVADLDVSDGRATDVLPVRAGRDTSESAYDRPDIRPTVRHRKARVFSEAADAALYVASFALPNHRDIRRVRIRWRYGTGVSALSVAHVLLVDDAKQLAYRPRVEYPQDWRARRVLGADTLFEVANALPGTWAVAETVALDDRSQLQALRAGRSNDPPRAFDPRLEATIPPSMRAFAAGTGGRRDRAVAIASEPTRVRIDADCASRCLVIDDALWYPGWHASVDGARAPVVRADYLLRGVEAGAGRHTVDMWFAPRSLAIGIVVTSFSAAGLLAMLALAARSAIAERNRSDRTLSPSRREA